MSSNLKRYFPAIVLAVILIVAAWTYSAAIRDSCYEADDYLFLSQVTKYGLIQSLVIPWKDHFLPLYRLLMGGLHLLFGNATPTKVVIVGFHLLNTALIFYIVRGYTESVILASFSSLTFSISSHAASYVLWSINGVWGVSLCFILFMTIYFDKFVRSFDPRPETTTMAHVGGTHKGDAEYVLPMPESAPPAKQPALKTHYIGLACFAIGLGFFTVALVGGIVVWLFMYIRVSRRGAFKQIRWRHARLILPFLSILVIYLAFRAYFNHKYFMLQDTLFQKALSIPPFSLQQKIAIIGRLPFDFYRYAIQQMMPYSQRLWGFVVIVYALLIVKELLFRRTSAYVALLWLAFAVVTLGFPVLGRIFYIFHILGSPRMVLASWYFCYPFAGTSIALGLLVRPTPSLEKILANASKRAHATMFVIAACGIAALNFNAARDIRKESIKRAVLNSSFYEIVLGYRSSMNSFLHSSAYSPSMEFYFKDDPAASRPDYPSSWSVMQHNLFEMYFPHVTNIRFVTGQSPAGKIYNWTPHIVRSG